MTYGLVYISIVRITKYTSFLYRWLVSKSRNLRRKDKNMTKAEIFDRLALIENVMIQSRVQLVGAMRMLEKLKQEIENDISKENE